MRVTGGSARGIRLRSPRGTGIRPTMDRVRSALFNIIAPFGMEGAFVADLFAGTGAIGIEALSRDAAYADFIESNQEHCRHILINLEEAKVKERATVHHMTVEKSIEALSHSYKFMLMDPPYSQPFPVNVIEQIASRGLLQKDGLLVVGHSSRVQSASQCSGLVRWQDRRYGDASLAFYRYESTEDCI